MHKDVSFQISTPLKTIFEIKYLEHISHDFIIDSDFQKKNGIILDVLIEPDLHL